MPRPSPARKRRRGHRLHRSWPSAAAIDRPSAEEPLRPGSTQVTGWTYPFGRERIRHVELRVDGAPAGSARLTLRPDIAEAFAMPEALLSGFESTVELPTLGTFAAELEVSIDVHGLDGGIWTSPIWRLPVTAEPQATEPADPPTAGSAVERRYRERDWPATAALDGPGRDWTRRRLGYDAWHEVVLVQDPHVSAGPAIAALDVLAERRPELELLVPGVASDSYLAHLIRRARSQTELEDRVTVPFVPAPAGGWESLADLTLTTSLPGGDGRDLGALIDSLDSACDMR